jgi:hypothetical protein
VGERTPPSLDDDQPLSNVTRHPVRRHRIHWAWVPAAVFATVTGWIRYGAWALIAVAAGLAVGLYAEWRARRRE